MGAWGRFCPSQGRRLCGPAFLTSCCLGLGPGLRSSTPAQGLPWPGWHCDLGVGKKLFF